MKIIRLDLLWFGAVEIRFHGSLKCGGPCTYRRGPNCGHAHMDEGGDYQFPCRYRNTP